MKTNILVCYEGGGYDGCIWEWNYFYIDKQGTFHDIQSSGSAGIDNLKDALALIEQDETHTYIYDLSSEQDIKTFSKESNAAHVTGVLQWFEDNPDTGVEFFAVCSACEQKMANCDDIALIVVAESDSLLCPDCYYAGECCCCESYVGDTEIVEVNPDEHHDYSYICTDCKEYHDGERKAESIKDLRWQSLCTGTPDMFSGKLREQRLQTNGGL